MAVRQGPLALAPTAIGGQGNRWHFWAISLACVSLALGFIATFTVTSSGARGTDAQAVPGNVFRTGSWPITTTLLAVGDSYLNQGSPNTNYGTATTMIVRISSVNRPVVVFSTSAITGAVGTQTLQSATLRLYISSSDTSWGTGRTVDAHRVLANWTEAGVTWNCPIDTLPSDANPNCVVQWNGGQFNSTATASVTHTNSHVGWKTWDVTADVAAILAAPATNYGWIIKKTNETQTGRATYHTRQYTNKPQLVIVAR